MSAEKALGFGLTGGIGCGKSTVADRLSRHGLAIIDTDEIAREVVEVGSEGHQKVVDAFGPEVLNPDQTIHRGRLGQLVFSDPIKRDLLNSLLHPLIRNRWQARRQELSGSVPRVSVVVVIPLLYETGLASSFESIACVACSSAVQRQRLEARGWDAGEIVRRLDSQLPTSTKMDRADRVLWNDGSLDALDAQVRYLVRDWLPAHPEHRQ